MSGKPPLRQDLKNSKRTMKMGLQTKKRRKSTERHLQESEGELKSKKVFRRWPNYLGNTIAFILNQESQSEKNKGEKRNEKKNPVGNQKLFKTHSRDMGRT